MLFRSAAQAIQAQVSAARAEPPIDIRIGIHTGEVIRAMDDFFGTVVNKAARIADTALPGEVRVSDATQLIVGDAFAYSDPIEVDLKGISGTQSVYVLT